MHTQQNANRLYMAYAIWDGIDTRVGKPHTSLQRAITACKGGKTGTRKGYVLEYNSGKIVFQNVIRGI